MVQHIVIVCIGQPSTNPRTVKEAAALQEAGYRVTVVYDYSINWAEATDKKILESLPEINWIDASAPVRKTQIRKLFNQVQYKMYRSAGALFPRSRFWQERSEAMFFNRAKKTAAAQKADLYIAHVLGALPVAAYAARKNRASYAFDIEDYHRGQVLPGSSGYRRSVLLEDAYINGAVYCSCASPLIAAAYRELYPAQQFITVNNAFSVKHIQPVPEKPADDSGLKLFWFSQTVGHNRGLEPLLEAVGALGNKNISVTLLGACSTNMKTYFEQYAEKSGMQKNTLLFHEPVPLDEIFTIAARHDIGLALENEATANRQICLTNKCYVYLLAGLAIIASDTPAQQLFISEISEVGECFPRDNAKALAIIINRLLNNKEAVLQKRKAALELARHSFNWEQEKKTLLNIVNGL